jgi:signal peptidase I
MRTALIAAAAAAAGTCLWLWRRYLVIAVHGESMSPTYRPGDWLLVRRTRPGSVGRGDCVVFGESPDEVPVLPARWLVKRAIAVPGDPVPRDDVPVLRTATGRTVPPGHMVVLGDNPAHSRDSRYFGYVTTDRLLGVVKRRMTQSQLNP